MQLPSYNTTPIHRYVYFRQLCTPSRGYAVIERLLVEEYTFDNTKRYGQMEKAVRYDGVPSGLRTGLSNYAGLRNIGNYHAVDPRWCVPYARVDDNGNAVQRCQIFAMLSTNEINLNYEYVVLRNRDSLNLTFIPSANSSQYSEYWSTSSDVREVILKKSRLQPTEVIPISRYTYPTYFAKWVHVPNLAVSKRVGVKV